MSYPKLCCLFENCSFETKQEKKLQEHLEKTHSTSLDAAFVEARLGGERPSCGCGCGTPARWKGLREGFAAFERGHNARVYTAFSDPEITQKSVEKRKQSIASGKIKPSWNVGLTKETDARIASSSSKASETLLRKYSEGDIVPWQRGLDKSDPRIGRMSQTKLAGFRTGKFKSWNLGLTKHTSTSLMSASGKISSAYERRQAGKRLSRDEVLDRVNSLGFDLDDDAYRTRKESQLRVVCRTCRGSQIRTLYSLEMSNKCWICSPVESKGQLEIFEFCKGNVDPGVAMGDRKLISPLEIDILSSRFNLAIEFNGLYWHSEKHKDKDYHSQKSSLCAEKGVKLLHVFEDEWERKRPIIESMIMHRAGLSGRKISARDCKVVDNIPRNERKRFFNSNHIDGDVASMYSVALVLGEEIVACASIRRPHHKKWNGSIELARFATLLGTNVRGALSRLIKHIRGRYQGKRLISYVDTRYGDGKGYLAAGFSHVSTSDRSFWWTDFDNRFNRFRYRANPILGLTEAQVAERAGVTKIWGCPQLLMVIE